MGSSRIVAARKRMNVVFVGGQIVFVSLEIGQSPTKLLSSQ